MQLKRRLEVAENYPKLQQVNINPFGDQDRERSNPVVGLGPHGPNQGAET